MTCPACWSGQSLHRVAHRFNHSSQRHDPKRHFGKSNAVSYDGSVPYGP